MITTVMTAVIDATPGRVWRALTDPSELIRLDARLLELLDPVEAYPQPGQHVRWRYELGAVPIVLHDRPLEVEPGQRLRSAIAMGLFHFDATWGMSSEMGGGRERTRVSFKLVASNQIPLVGGLLDRFAVRRLAAEYADSRLRALQKWCESH